MDKWYSVLHHLILCHDLAKLDGETQDICFKILVHDLHEALYTDIPRPLKQFLKDIYNFDYNILCDDFDFWMYKNLNLSFNITDHDIIKYYDNWALIIEKTKLVDNQVDWEWGYEYDVDRIPLNYILELSKEELILLFKSRYNLYVNKNDTIKK